MKYTAEAFDEWWFTTQFDRAYWQVNSQKHQTEYKWAKLAWDAARRDLLAEVERLQDEMNEARATCYDCEYYGPHKAARLEFQDQLQAAQALAATHLADQELLVARERKRVARECAEMCEPWGVADRIRTRYGVEE